MTPPDTDLLMRGTSKTHDNARVEVLYPQTGLPATISLTPELRDTLRDTLRDIVSKDGVNTFLRKKFRVYINTYKTSSEVRGLIQAAVKLKLKSTDAILDHIFYKWKGKV